MVNIMKKNPLVTIIITTYKGDWKLCRAINSCLLQTYKNIEVIVVDDNGEGTKEQCKTASMLQVFDDDSRFVYIKHEVNKNGATARNTGIDFAHGDYIAFLDDDDVYREDRIEVCVNAIISSDKQNVAAYVGVITVASGNCISKTMPMLEGNIQENLIVDQGLLGSGSNIFLPKNVAKEIGGFDTAFRRFQDVEFMVRASQFLYMIPIKECMIIKDNTNVRFVPNYNGLKDATLLFLKKFQKHIEIINNSKTAIFNKYLFLMLYAYKCNDVDAINDSKKLMYALHPNKKLLIKSIIKGNFLKYSKTALYKNYKKITDARKNYKIRKTLNKHELIFVNSVLTKE